jgi:branched-chain amino acid transport system permease protein
MGAFLSSQFMDAVFSGIGEGVVYAMVALSLVIIWRSTHVLNFAQGAMAMGAAYVGLTQVDRGLSIWWCIVLAMVAGLFAGALTERVLVRPLYGKPELNPIVVMVGYLILIEAVVATIWGTTSRNINSPLSQVDFVVGGHPILLSPYLVFQIAAAIVVLLLFAALFRFTKLGLQLRAAANAPEVARLLGIRVNRMLTVGWALSSVVGVVAAIVTIIGNGSANPQIMETVFVSGFIAAAIGGLESPGGAVAGGLILGVSTSLIETFWSSNVAPITPLIILFAVLVVRPQGLFTRHAERRV